MLPKQVQTGERISATIPLERGTVLTTVVDCDDSHLIDPNVTIQVLTQIFVDDQWVTISGFTVTGSPRRMFDRFRNPIPRPFPIGCNCDIRQVGTRSSRIVCRILTPTPVNIGVTNVVN